MPDNEFKFITIYETNNNGKTSIWFVDNKNHGESLGAIKWYGPWRQYVFYPVPLTLYSSGCLQDIQKFIDQAMKERRDKKNG